MTYKFSEAEPVLKFDDNIWTYPTKPTIMFVVNEDHLISNSSHNINGNTVIIINSEVFHRIFSPMRCLNALEFRNSDNFLIKTSNGECPRKFLNEFHSVKPIGRGGFGRVYSAVNSLDLHEYAIKRIKIDSTKVNKSITREIMKEFQILAKLNHGNIVRYHTAWCEQINNDEKDLLFENGDYDDQSLTSQDSVDASFTTQSENISNSSVACSISVQNSLSVCSSIANLSNNNCSQTSDGIIFEYSSNANQNSKSDENEPDGTMELYKNKCSQSPKIKFSLYIQMELCHSNLKDWLCARNENPGEFCEFDNKNIRSLARQLLRGIGYIHSKSIIHRDIKPANVFLLIHENNDIQLKIGDFGLAKSVEYVSRVDSNNNRLKCTTNVGTGFYMAPEVCNLENQLSYYNHKCDLYSVGIIIIELMRKIKTVSELSKIVERTSEGYLYDDLSENWPIEAPYVVDLISKSPDCRPEANFILKETICFNESINKNGFYNFIKRIAKENVHLKKMNKFLNEENSNLKKGIQRLAK